MARRPRRTPAPPPPPSFVQATIDTIKRNPWKAATAAAVFLGAVPGAIAGYNAGFPILDPIIPAVHYWVRDQLLPISDQLNTQAKSIDQYLLFQQREALDKVKAEPAAKSSPTVQDKIKDLQQQINDTEQRLKQRH